MQNLRCESEFHFQMNAYKTRFETEAIGSSEMTYYEIRIHPLVKYIYISARRKISEQSRAFRRNKVMAVFASPR